MRPFAVVRGALGAEALADLRREADALAAKTPPTVANGCVLEPVVAAAGEEWRADRAAYAAGTVTGDLWCPSTPRGGGVHA